MGRTKAQSVEVVTAQLETMNASSVAAIARHAELLRILGDALVPASSRKRTSPPFGKRRRPSLAESEAKALLDARTTPAIMENVVGSDEAAQLLGLGSRQAIHVRLKKGDVLAVSGARRGLLFPIEQFVGAGQVVEGLAELQQLLGAGQATWAWLDDASDTLDGKRPIDMLREGHVERVIAAARSASQGDFD